MGSRHAHSFAAVFYLTWLGGRFGFVTDALRFDGTKESHSSERKFVQELSSLMPRFRARMLNQRSEN